MREWTSRVARARVTLGFVAGTVALWLAQPDCRSLAAGAAIGAMGEALRIWAAGHLDKSREVTSSGPYRYLAHPLYTGSAIMGAGLAMASRSLVVAAIVFLYFVVTIAAAVRTEDAFLRQKFGETYVQYRGAAAPRSSRGFDPTRVVKNREYRAVLGFIAVMGILVWKSGCW